MATHNEKRLLPYMPEQIFDLVADVEKYPEFLPLWRDVAVQRPQGENRRVLYHTEQTLQLGPVQKRFCTETLLERPNRIQVESSDPLFKHFSIQWVFQTQPEAACLVDFSLRCEAGSFLLRPILEVVLMEAAQGMVRAFERRAHALYRGF